MDSLVTEHDHQVVDKICRLINEVVTAFGTLLLSCLDDFCSLLGDFPSDDWDTTGKKPRCVGLFRGMIASIFGWSSLGDIGVPSGKGLARGKLAHLDSN